MRHCSADVDTGGVRIHTRRWEPDGPAKAAVGLVHGIGEHSGRYGAVAARLTEAGYAVCAFDLRNHGQSGGRRGDTRFAAAYDDIDRLLGDAAERFGGIPRVLYGHSLGGLLVLAYTLKRRPALAGVVATGAALHNALREQRAKVVGPIPSPTTGPRWASGATRWTPPAPNGPRSSSTTACTTRFTTNPSRPGCRPTSWPGSTSTSPDPASSPTRPERHAAPGPRGFCGHETA